jgi:hypothetical protein
VSVGVVSDVSDGVSVGVVNGCEAVHDIIIIHNNTQVHTCKHACTHEN